MSQCFILYKSRGHFTEITHILDGLTRYVWRNVSGVGRDMKSGRVNVFFRYSPLLWLDGPGNENLYLLLEFQ